MKPDIKAIEERRKRLYKSDADNVYVEDYLADTEFLLNRINDLTTQLAESKADYDAAVEDITNCCDTCANDITVYKCFELEDGDCKNWKWRGRQGNG